MKEEQEFLWLVNLLKSDFSKLGGCKKDFEKCAGASENSKLFKELFEELKNDESIFFVENKSTTGKSVDIYMLDKKKLVKKLKQCPLYNSVKGIIVREESAFGI